MQHIRAGDSFTTAEKREALDFWYAELATGPDSRLPRHFNNEYRKSKAGFTDDLIDRALLKGLPEGAS